jgi:hypothetical protein
LVIYQESLHDARSTKYIYKKTVFMNHTMNKFYSRFYGYEECNCSIYSNNMLFFTRNVTLHMFMFTLFNVNNVARDQNN